MTSEMFSPTTDNLRIPSRHLGKKLKEFWGNSRIYDIKKSLFSIFLYAALTEDKRFIIWMVNPSNLNGILSRRWFLFHFVNSILRSIVLRYCWPKFVLFLSNNVVWLFLLCVTLIPDKDCSCRLSIFFSVDMIFPVNEIPT